MAGTDLNTLKYICNRILLAIRALHNRGLVHGDLIPGAFEAKIKQRVKNFKCNLLSRSKRDKLVLYMHFEFESVWIEWSLAQPFSVNRKSLQFAISRNNLFRYLLYVPINNYATYSVQSRGIYLSSCYKSYNITSHADRRLVLFDGLDRHFSLINFIFAMFFTVISNNDTKKYHSLSI